MILGVPGIGGGKSFYGPVRSGAINDHLAKMDDPKFAERMNFLIDAALDGSNVTKGHTDQGSRGDPNYDRGGIGVNINGERFNHWGYPGAVQFQQDLMKGYADADSKSTQVASLGTTATDANPEAPVQSDSESKPLTQNTQLAQAKTGTPLDFLRPDQPVRLRKAAETAIKTKAIDDERAATYAEREKRRVSDDRESEIIKDLTSENPTISAKEIGEDKALTPNARLSMIGLAERLAKKNADKMSDTYGSKFLELWQRMNLPQGDPNKLTDPGSLPGYVGLDDGLTLAGLDRLRTEMAGRKTPQGAAEAKMKDQFIAMAKHQISGSDDFTHIRDPKGDELFLQWMTHTLPEYDKQRAAGVPAAKLLDKDSPEYLGKTIPQFRRSIEQRTKDMLSDVAGGSNEVKPAPNAAPKTYNTLGDVVSAVQSGAIPRSEGEAIALQRGWIRPTPKPTIPDDVQVPQSR
jgi:hypothetical protein